MQESPLTPKQPNSPGAGDAVRKRGPDDPRVLPEGALPLRFGDPGILPQEVQNAAETVDEPDRLVCG